MRTTTSSSSMKSTEVKLSIKGLAGITVDSTKANSEPVKVFVRVVRDGKLYATSPLSGPLKMSPTEKANAKLKRHVALWNDTEQSLVFQAVQANILELHICLRLPNGKDVQIGTGSLNMPVNGAMDVNIREGRQNLTSPYRIDSSGDARMRLYATSVEKETGAAESSTSSPCVPVDHSGIEVSSLGKSSNRELHIVALGEPQLSPMLPATASCEDDSLEPSVEQVFTPKSHDLHNEANDVPGNNSKNLKKKSPLAKFMKRANVMDWGRKKKADTSPTKLVKPTLVPTTKRTAPTAQAQKEKKLNTQKTAALAPARKETVVSGGLVQKVNDTTSNKIELVAQVQTEQEMSPTKIAPISQVQKVKETNSKLIQSLAQAKKEKESTPKKVEPIAHIKTEMESTTKEIEPKAQVATEEFKQKHSSSPKKADPANSETKNKSPRINPAASSSAWESLAFDPLQKKVALVSPERTNSAVTTKAANSTPRSAVRQQEQILASSAESSPQLFRYNNTPKSDVWLRSKGDDADGFEDVDFSFPTPEFPQHETPRKESRQSNLQPVKSHRTSDETVKRNLFQQDDQTEPDLPRERPREEEESHHTRQPSPAPAKRTQARDMDDYSLYSEDDSTFLAKPKQIFGIIKCCIMGDEDSIYGYDETLTFDDTLGEEDATTVNSYDDTLSSDLPSNNWWCQGGFGGKPQAPAVIRRRQIWKERMQQLAEQNSNVKELFEAPSSSESEAGSTVEGGDEDEEATTKDDEKVGQGQLPTTASEKQENCSIDSSNSVTLGLVQPPVMRGKITP